MLLKLHQIMTSIRESAKLQNQSSLESISWAKLSSRRRHSWMHANIADQANIVFSFWQHKGSHTTRIKRSRILLWSNVYPRCVRGSDEELIPIWFGHHELPWISMNFCICTGDIAASSLAEDCRVFPCPQPATHIVKRCIMFASCSSCASLMSFSWMEMRRCHGIPRLNSCSHRIFMNRSGQRSPRVMDTLVERQVLEWRYVQLCKNYTIQGFKLTYMLYTSSSASALNLEYDNLG